MVLKLAKYAISLLKPHPGMAGNLQVRLAEKGGDGMDVMVLRSDCLKAEMRRVSREKMHPNYLG
jgi:hypothetical protein